MRAAAVLAVLVLPAAQAAGSRPKDLNALLRRASIDAHPALLDTYLLTTAAQATVLNLKWTFGRWGLERSKERAAGHYDRFSSKVSVFLKSCEAADAATNPLQGQIAELMKSRKVREAAADVPESASEQIAEIRRLRAENYDGEASRSALIRARASVASLEPALGPARLVPSQSEALSHARGLASELRAIEKDLARLPPGKEEPPAARAARKLVGEDLAWIRRDTAELESSIELLALYFRINNYHAAGGDLKDAPKDKDSRGELSDPDMISEVQRSQRGNIEAALERAAKDARQSLAALSALVPQAKAEAAAAAREGREARAASRAEADPDLERAVEEGLDAVTLSGQMLDVKSALLRERLSALGLALDPLSSADAASARAGYRAKDRSADLGKSEKVLAELQAARAASKKPKPVALSAEQTAALEALQGLHGELSGALSAVSGMHSRLSQGRRTARGGAARKLQARLGSLEETLEDLARERRLLELAFWLARYDEASFDQSR